MRDKGIYNIKRAMPRMSWDVKNLYNLYQRTVNGPHKNAINFTRTSKTLFQQRWVCKAVVRAYHGDYIPEKVFKRYYLPETLPDVRPRRTVLGGNVTSLEAFAMRKKKEDQYQAEQDRRGMAPVGSLMFSEVERRIDVFVFRSCFAHSVYEARRLVLHGDVYLNGEKWSNPNTRLAPGDMVHVNPSAIRFLQGRANAGSAQFTEEVAEATSEEESKVDASAEVAVDAKSAEEPSAKTETVTTKEAPSTASTPFNLPPYAAPHLFIPAYIEPNFKTCTAIYVRHPTARPGYSEIPTPYDADGEVVRFAWEWYAAVRPRIRSKRQLERAPLDRAKILLEDKPNPKLQKKMREKLARLRQA